MGGTGSIVSFTRCRYAGYCAKSATSPIQPRSATDTVASAVGARPSLTRSDTAARTGPSASVAIPPLLSVIASVVSLQPSPAARRETTIVLRPVASMRTTSGIPRGTDAGRRSNPSGGSNVPRQAAMGLSTAAKPSRDARAEKFRARSITAAQVVAIASARVSRCASAGASAPGKRRRATSCAARAPSTPARPTSSAPRSDPERSCISSSTVRASARNDDSSTSRLRSQRVTTAARSAATPQKSKGMGRGNDIHRPSPSVSEPIASNSATMPTTASATTESERRRSDDCSR